MLNKLFLFLNVLAFLFASCNNEDDCQIFNDTKLSSVVTVAGKQIPKIDGTLVFQSEEELKEVANELIPLIHTKASDGLLKADYSNVVKLELLMEELD